MEERIQSKLKKDSSKLNENRMNNADRMRGEKIMKENEKRGILFPRRNVIVAFVVCYSDHPLSLSVSRGYIRKILLHVSGDSKRDRDFFQFLNSFFSLFAFILSE